MSSIQVSIISDSHTAVDERIAIAYRNFYHKIVNPRVIAGLRITEISVWKNYVACLDNIVNEELLCYTAHITRNPTTIVFENEEAYTHFMLRWE